MWSGELLYFATLVIVFSFIGLILGGVIGGSVYKFLEYQLENLFSFCGGLLLGLLMFELVPETLQQYSPIGVVIGIFLGITLMLLLERTIHSNQNVTNSYNFAKQSFLLLSLAMAIHNIPSGLALGSSYGSEIMTPFLITLFFHQIPEGIALFIPIMISGSTFLSYIKISGALVLMLGFFILIGGYIGQESSKWSTLLMGVAIGSIGYVTIHEILWKVKGKVSFRSFITYCLLGISCIYIYVLFL